MPFGNFLKAFTAKANDFYADVTLKDDLERAVWVGVSFAYADGQMEPEEAAKLPQIAQAMFRNFEPGEIAAVVRAATEMHELSPDLGINRTIELLDGVESRQEARKLFALGLAIAKADGEVEGAEKALAERLARTLGVSIRDLGF